MLLEFLLFMSIVGNVYDPNIKVDVLESLWLHTGRKILY